MAKKTIAVLFGGVSSEHEVSRMSATSVLNNLNREKFDVLAVGIKKDGSWHLYPGPTQALCTGEWEACEENIPVAFCPGSGMKGLVAFENGRVRFSYMLDVDDASVSRNIVDITVKPTI